MTNKLWILNQAISEGHRLSWADRHSSWACSTSLNRAELYSTVPKLLTVLQVYQACSGCPWYGTASGVWSTQVLWGPAIHSQSPSCVAVKCSPHVIAEALSGSQNTAVVVVRSPLAQVFAHLATCLRQQRSPMMDRTTPVTMFKVAPCPHFRAARGYQ